MIKKVFIFMMAFIATVCAERANTSFANQEIISEFEDGTDYYEIDINTALLAEEYGMEKETKLFTTANSPDDLYSFYIRPYI